MSKKLSRRRDRRDDQEELPLPADHRSMEKLLADVGRLLEEQGFETIEEANAFLDELLASGGPPPARKPETPLEKAQALMYEAWGAESSRQRVRLARKALSISKDCADAYVLLAEETARSPEEARDLYEAGVQAGERALGDEFFATNAGAFWGILETRSYMRAREGLAMALWALGEHAEAIAHYQEMLRLNPNDNQGIRYQLLYCLLDEDRDGEAEKLLKDYADDVSAVWQYTQALLLFGREGASRKAAAHLKKALKYNPHVPEYLLGRRRITAELPPYMGMGDETEAAHYFAEAVHLWLRQEGALEWLRKASPAPS